MAKKNLIVGQSGGPTAVINSSLYGVVSEALAHPDEIEHVYGMENGIEGFLNGTVLDFTEALPGEKLSYLQHTPGAYLGSCRYKLPESLEDPVYPELFRKFEEMNIGYFFYIGGNDSMDTVSKLSRYAERIGSDIRVMGEPKTIDNDLVHTDHTPGFGSAAKYVASTVREIILDANVYEKKSVTIIEIMGRHAGWLTAASALARKYTGDNPLLIYLPETAFDTEAFLKKVEESFEKNCNVVVCVSEGIHDAEGTFICEYDNSVGTDSFGHKMLAGCGKNEEGGSLDYQGIAVTFNPDQIVPEAARQVAGVYYAVQTRDPELYKSLLCNEYLAYTEQYWQQTGYTYDMLLGALYSQTADLVGGEYKVTGVEITRVECDNAAKAVAERLDEVSDQLWNKRASAYWISYASVYSNVTIEAQSGGRSYTMKNNVVYVIQNGDSYLLALEWGS